VTTDAWLAIFHHLAVFTLLGAITAEFALVRASMSGVDIHRLSRIDAVYGMSAGAAILAGIARVIWGVQPADFYLENPVFWLKMAAFGGTGLLSIVPTRQYARWHERAAKNSARPLDRGDGACPALRDCGARALPRYPALCRADGARHRSLARRIVARSTPRVE
jgi:putative membrane protein